MYCEGSLSSGAHHSFSDGIDASIALDDIKVHDKVLIKTKNSEYRFSVIDPLHHKGMLSGGALGEEPREAVLIESVCKFEEATSREFRGLKTGARALFYISSGRSVERVTTSEIFGLTLIKAADRKSLSLLTTD